MLPHLSCLYIFTTLKFCSAKDELYPGEVHRALASTAENSDRVFPTSRGLCRAVWVQGIWDRLYSLGGEFNVHLLAKRLSMWTASPLGSGEWERSGGGDFKLQNFKYYFCPISIDFECAKMA